MSKLDFISDEKIIANTKKEDCYSIDTLKQIDDVTEEQRNNHIAHLMLRIAQEIALHRMLCERHTMNIVEIATRGSLTDKVIELHTEMKMNLELMRCLGIDQIHLTMLLRKLIGKNSITDNIEMKAAMQKVGNRNFEELKNAIVGKEIRCSECHKVVIWEGWLPYMQTTTTIPCTCGASAGN